MSFSYPLLAHAFGQSYTLPVPLWLYLYGGAAAVVLSFVVVGYFVDRKETEASLPRRSFRLPSPIIWLVRLITWTLLILTVVAGWVGSQNPSANFSITFFWIIFYVGLPYLILLIGDIWPLITAWGSAKPLARYPRRLGSWPALVFYLGFIWLEILSSGYGIVPFNLSRLLIAYLTISVAGALIYGRDWFRYGDLFSIFFRLFGRVSPLAHKNRRVELRAPVVGLLDEAVTDFGLLIFILFMLSSTAFDGLRETAPFAAFYNWLVGTLPALQQLPPVVINSSLLLLSPLVFLCIYWLFMSLVKRAASTKRSVRELMLTFAPSLVPIAVAYNIAHYYTLVAVQGQLIIKLASDPLGRGWDLFGTAGYRISPGLFNAASVWYTQITLIVLGHMAAVYISHLIALRLYPNSRKAVASQYPMLALMVVYTMVSLWIIAQPIVIG